MEPTKAIEWYHEGDEVSSTDSEASDVFKDGPPFKMVKLVPKLWQKEIADNPHYETIAMLVDMGANLEEEDNDGVTPLFQAIKNHDITLIKILEFLGADVNHMVRAKHTLFMGGNSLHYAAAKGTPEILKCLLDLGANPYLEDHFGKTPLHWAAWDGKLDNLKYLYGKMRDLSDEDCWDRSVLHMAADGGHAEIVTWLIANDCNPNALCSEDNSPLHYAAKGGYNEVVEILVRSGAIVDARDILGRTPLMYAVRNGRLDTVKLLLELGADPKAKDDFEVEVIEWAAHIDSDVYPDLVVALQDTIVDHY